MLPFSFDYGFSQLSTAFLVGASAVLMDHLFARDIVAMLAKERITGLAGVPPLWSQLAELPWPARLDRAPALHHELGRCDARRDSAEAARARAEDAGLPDVRSHGGVSLHVSAAGRDRSPARLHGQGDSERGDPRSCARTARLCGPNEPGELVHRGSLVGLGYWNDPDKTAERFKPAPGRPTGS